LTTAFENYIEEAHRLRKKYADKIDILVGLETDYITEIDLDRLSQLLETYGEKIHYMVGSVHHVNEIGFDFDRATYEKAINSFNTSPDTESLDDSSLTTFLETYFDAQFALLQRFHPEVIGHFDLCCLFRPGLNLPDYDAVWSKVQRNVKFAIAYGALFELNAAAFRKGWETAYPAEPIFKVRRHI